MAIVAGADGCEGGWLVVWTTGEGSHQSDIFSGPEQIWRYVKPDVLAVDCPIGLVAEGDRECDREARRLLGTRSCCVFTTPIRPAINSRTRDEADLCSRHHGGKGVAAQHFGIYPHVRSWDEFLRSEPEAKNRCYEVHPELIFHHLNRGAPAMTKHKEPGLQQRIGLLEEAGEFDLKTFERHPRHASDVLDALAAHWTACRIERGVAEPLGTPVPVDSEGLPMTMWI